MRYSDIKNEVERRWEIQRAKIEQGSGSTTETLEFLSALMSDALESRVDRNTIKALLLYEIWNELDIVQREQIKGEMNKVEREELQFAYDMQLAKRGHG